MSYEARGISEVDLVELPENIRYSVEHEELTFSREGIIEGSKRIADIRNALRTPAEIEATGRRLAQAWNSYVAFSELAERIAGWSDREPYHSHGSPLDEIEEAIEEAKKALELARAEG